MSACGPQKNIRSRGAYPTTTSSTVCTFEGCFVSSCIMFTAVVACFFLMLPASSGSLEGPETRGFTRDLQRFFQCGGWSKLISVAFCSPAKSLTFSGLVENPLVGKKLKSSKPSKCTKVMLCEEKAATRNESSHYHSHFPLAIAVIAPFSSRIFRETPRTFCSDHSQHRQGIKNAHKGVAHLPVYKEVGLQICKPTCMLPRSLDPPLPTLMNRSRIPE